MSRRGGSVRLPGKVAIITGSAQGIGKGTAKLFAKEGARVVVADIDDHHGAETVAEITADGGEAAFLRTDVESERDLQAMVTGAVERYGKLDILMNNAYWS